MVYQNEKNIYIILLLLLKLRTYLLIINFHLIATKNFLFVFQQQQIGKKNMYLNLIKAA